MREAAGRKSVANQMDAVFLDASISQFNGKVRVWARRPHPDDRSNIIDLGFPFREVVANDDVPFFNPCNVGIGNRSSRVLIELA